MSDLIPNITISEFKKFHVGDIKRMKSIEVYADGEHLFTAIIPKGDWVTKDHIKTSAETLGMTSNIVEGLDPTELKETVDAFV